jgi:ribosome assembly protein RRB1
MKMSSLYKTKPEDSDVSDDDALDEDAIIEWKHISHTGGVNRIRTMPHPSSHIVATWSDVGRVNIYDATDLVTCLDTQGTTLSKKDRKLYSLKHKEEGFALDWSKAWLGRLISGDIKGEIYLTTAQEADFSTDDKPFLGHVGSVEDLQWSPTERTVFASCSSDCSLRIWDTRAKKHAPQLSVSKAHSQDVNVLSWNKNTNHLLASGSDDGSFSVWDLRSFVSEEKPEAAATFKWHKDAITSIEWHPTEASVLAVSGADDQVTLWDLSVERDAEEEKEVFGKTGLETLGVDVPPQLMFVHQVRPFPHKKS